MRGNKELSGLSICSLVFTLIGASFLIVSIALGVMALDHEISIAFIVFPIVGIVFFSVGILLCVLNVRKKKKIEKLIADNRYVMAEITDVRINYSIQYNNINPYKIYCEYEDIYGKRHRFVSKNLLYCPDSLKKGSEIKVYVSEDFSDSYVDVAGNRGAVIHTRPVYTQKNLPLLIMGIIFSVNSLLLLIIGILVTIKVHGMQNWWVVPMILGIIIACFGTVGISFLLTERGKQHFIKQAREDRQYVMGTIMAIFQRSGFGIGLGHSQENAARENFVPVDRESSFSSSPVIEGEDPLSYPEDNLVAAEPFYVQCCYAESDGTQHIFQSQIFWEKPVDLAIGRQVKIYYKNRKYKRFFVEL